MTVQQLVSRALTLCGKLGAGRGASVSESTVAFDILNSLLDSWATQRQFVFGLDAVAISLVSGTRSYTLSTRPKHIESAEVVTTAGGLSYPSPLEIVGEEGFRAVGNQGDVTPFPKVLWCDYGFPTTKVYLAPTPGSGTLNIYTWQTIAGFAALSDTVTFPPGMERAMADLLAVEIAPAFDLPLTPALAANADAARGALAKLNLWHAADAKQAAYPEGGAKS